MKIIKEYCPSVNKCVIRTNTYCKNLEHINNLYNEAKKDFPDLQFKDIEVIQFAGRYYARTYGIEFNVNNKIVPDSYSIINQLENTF